MVKREKVGKMAMSYGADSGREETSNNSQKDTQKSEAKANKGFKKGLRAMK